MGNPLTPGEHFAGYEIVRKLGAGGMGAVYQARDRDLPRFVALKLLTTADGDPEHRIRFRREADAVARLEHPNIVTVYARGEHENQLWISMTFVDGIDVASALRFGAIHPARAVRIIGETAAALDHAHETGILHRDVKPANILLTQGRHERVLLTDFGIAKLADESRQLTRKGEVLASFQYAAPERLTESDDADHRADVYSLGCTLFHMLTGRLPFPGDSVAKIAYGHAYSPLPRPSAHIGGLPRGFDDVVARALAKRPEQRYASCVELARAATQALRESTPGGFRAIDPNTVFPSGSERLGPTGPRDTGARNTSATTQAGQKTGPTPRQGTSAATGLSSQRGTPMPPVTTGPSTQRAMPGTAARNTGPAPVPPVRNTGPAPQRANSVPVTTMRNAGPSSQRTSAPSVPGAMRPEASGAPETKVLPQSIATTGARTSPPGDVPTEYRNEPSEFGREPNEPGSRGHHSGRKPLLVAVALVVAGLAVTAYLTTRGTAEDNGAQTTLSTTISSEVTTTSVAVTTTVQTSDTVVQSTGTPVTTDQVVETVAVPDVVGSLLAKAKAQLESLGFSVVSIDRQDDRAKGTVVAVDPTPGTKYRVGSKVTVYVSTGPVTATTLTMPDVTGMTVAQAESALRNLGWKGSVRQSTTAVTDSSRVGVIISQTPASGTTLALDAAVTLQVGKLVSSSTPVTTTTAVAHG
ncbi:protein kinase [Nocardia sp. NPDC050406]|uniref:protein kinase domain-containing protein n=1 Tax=Nocardia sp. NPDC050406 TaxID=3364318 RepID=UPI00379314C9